MPGPSPTPRNYAPAARRLTLAAPVLVCLLTLPSVAHALTISGTSVKTLPESTPVHADASTTDVIYYLDLHADPSVDERFSVRLVPPRFATRGPNGASEGSSVDGPLQFGLYGPGTVGKVVTEPTFAPLCSSRDRAFHGYETGAATVDIALPAGANTTLAIRYKTGRRAPWIDTDFRLRFSFAQQLFGTYDAGSPLFGAATSVAAASTHTQTQQVPVAGNGSRVNGTKITRGKFGAHLLLETTPKGTYGDEDTAGRKIARSTRVKVKGQLLPATTGKKVLLQWAKPGKPLKTAARITTGAGGRFTASLKPPGAGSYELWASYPQQPGPLAADSTSCPARFQVR